MKGYSATKSIEYNFPKYLRCRKIKFRPQFFLHLHTYKKLLLSHYLPYFILIKEICFIHKCAIRYLGPCVGMHEPKTILRLKSAPIVRFSLLTNQ